MNRGIFFYETFAFCFAIRLAIRLDTVLRKCYYVVVCLQGWSLCLFDLFERMRFHALQDRHEANDEDG